LYFYKLLLLISWQITSLSLRNIYLLRLQVRGFRKVSLLSSLMMLMMLVVRRGWRWYFIVKLQVIRLKIIMVIIVVFVWIVTSINALCLDTMSSIVLYLVVTLISMGIIIAAIIIPLL